MNIFQKVEEKPSFSVMLEILSHEVCSSIVESAAKCLRFPETKFKSAYLDTYCIFLLQIFVSDFLSLLVMR